MKLPFWANLNTLAAAIILALLVYIGVQKVELLTCRLHSKDLSHQLELISKAKNDQHETTKGNIVKAGEGNKSADRIAKRIEAAPVVPGKCETPPIIMGADL